MYKYINSDLLVRKIIVNMQLLIIFFLICLGLGYAVLNRFDPTSLVSMNDTAFYAAIVMNGIDGVSADFPDRILVPYLAHLVFLIIPEIGSWNMVNFALLIVNSFFTSISAMLILQMSYKITKRMEYSILSCMFFLLNFHVINFYLVSSIDSAYGFSLLLLIYSLYSQKFNYLPLLAILGCMIKEVFLPVGSGFILGWLFYEIYKYKNIEISKVILFISFMAIGVITILLSDLIINSGNNTFLYWNEYTQNLSSQEIHLNFSEIFIDIVKFFFTLGWILVLAIPSLKDLPANLVFSSFFACIITVILGYAAGVQGSDYARFIYIPGAFIFSLGCSISIFKMLNNLLRKIN